VNGILFSSSSHRHVIISSQNHFKKWKLGGVNRITVHESCHQFGASDEYTSTTGTPCDSCGGEFGCDNIPNRNCGDCARPQQACAMNENSLRLCEYTKGQIGWSDMFVELFTADEFLAGTDDTVHIDIGHRWFNLGTPNHDDRERDNREGYAIFDS